MQQVEDTSMRQRGPGHPCPVMKMMLEAGDAKFTAQSQTAKPAFPVVKDPSALLDRVICHQIDNVFDLACRVDRESADDKLSQHFGNLVLYVAERSKAGVAIRVDSGSIVDVEGAGMSLRMPHLHWLLLENVLSTGARVTMPSRLPYRGQEVTTEMILLLTKSYYPTSMWHIEHALKHRPSFRRLLLTLCCIRLEGAQPDSRPLATTIWLVPNEILFHIVSWIPFSYTEELDAYMLSCRNNPAFYPDHQYLHTAECCLQ